MPETFLVARDVVVAVEFVLMVGSFVGGEESRSEARAIYTLKRIMADEGMKTVKSGGYRTPIDGISGFCVDPRGFDG
jgi:hypothetical protein